MEDKQYVVKPEMVYGAEWMKRHSAELEKWEWCFKPWITGDLIVPVSGGWREIRAAISASAQNPAIILLRRKVPPVPQLREIYGKDSVEIPPNKEWTGQFRVPIVKADSWLCPGGTASSGDAWALTTRLILRDRTPPTRVWFKAETVERKARVGEFVWRNSRWVQVPTDWIERETELTVLTYLCATRHEDVDTTPTVVTQAGVDAAWARQYGGGE